MNRDPHDEANRQQHEHRVRPYPTTHQKGVISLENPLLHDFGMKQVSQLAIQGDMDVGIAEDGRVWININGICFLRFKPLE